MKDAGNQAFRTHAPELDTIVGLGKTGTQLMRKIVKSIEDEWVRSIQPGLYRHKVSSTRPPLSFQFLPPSLSRRRVGRALKPVIILVRDEQRKCITDTCKVTYHRGGRTKPNAAARSRRGELCAQNTAAKKRLKMFSSSVFRICHDFREQGESK